MIERLLNTSVTIQRRGATGTDAHGSPTTATTSSTTVLGYIEQTQAEETEGAQKTARATYLLVLPAGTSIDATDRVVIGSTTYEVHSIPWNAHRATTGQTHHVECKIVEVTG